VEDKKQSVLEQSPAMADKPLYYIYHFGSKTCIPCEQMKAQTWTNQQLKDLMQQKKVKLVFFDAGDSEDDKFFKFYQAKYYPTIVLLKADNLETTIERLVGFQSAETIVKVLEKNL
jgi:thioredoxin-related protein